MLLTSDVEAVINLDWTQIVLGIITILIGLKFLTELFTWLFNKFGIKFSWKEEQNKDHKATIENTEAIKSLVESNIKITEKITELTKVVDEINEKVTEVQKEEKDSRDADQIIIASRLNQYCKYYINDLKGIPEDEYESFTNMYKTYVERGDGNPGLNSKVQYCIKELPILSNK